MGNSLPPTPGYTIRERSAEERSNHTGRAIGRSNQAGICRGPMGRSHESNNRVAASNQAGGSGASNCAANDKRNAARCSTWDGKVSGNVSIRGLGLVSPVSRTADQAADFENNPRREKRDPEVGVLVQLAPGRLECCQCQEKRGPIPSHLVNALEFIGDARNSGRYNGLLKCERVVHSLSGGNQPCRGPPAYVVRRILGSQS